MVNKLTTWPPIERDTSGSMIDLTTVADALRGGHDEKNDRDHDEEHAMNESLPDVYLARHGETAWSLSGRHTGRTDIPLTERGEDNARRLRGRLEGITFTEVLVSPLQRARRTCELAGFAAVAKVTPDLVEWDYGDYEGRLTSDIRRERPGWYLFRDGCPGVSRSRRWVLAPTAWSPAYGPMAVASSSSATAISPASSPRAGWTCLWRMRGTCCSVPHR